MHAPKHTPPINYHHVRSHERPADRSIWRGSKITKSNNSSMNLVPAFAGTTLPRGALISLNDALLKDRDRLIRSNLELEHFATLAAHELKSPLHSAFSWLNILSEQLPTNNFGAVSESIEIIQKNLKNAISYVNELLQISKVKEQQANQDVCVVTDVVSDILMVHADSLKDANASVHQTKLPQTLANRKHLECVFSNLIGNSIKYKHPERDLTITIGACERDDCIEYFVKDNGLGIPGTKLEDIFTLFESFAPPTEAPSTGIGLAFCKKIITLYQGRIWAESSEGHGSTIKIQLPKTALNDKKS